MNDDEVEEPSGFSNIELSMARDDKMHGMQFDASTSSLQFYGSSSEFLLEQKRLYGLKSEVIFSAFSKCDITAEFELVIKGKLNFGKLKESCGTDCLVSIPIESETCEVVLKNRFDQKVDIDVAKSFDGGTILPIYAGLNMEKTLHGKALSVIDEARNSVQTTEVLSSNASTYWKATEVSNIFDAHVAPKLDNVVNASLGEFNVSSFIQVYPDGAANRPPVSFGYTVDTTELLGSIDCGLTNVVVDFRIKGSHTMVAPGISSMAMNIKVFKLPAGAAPDSFNWVQLYDFALPSVSSGTVTFDKTGGFNGTLTQGDRLTFSLYIRTTRFGEITTYSITLDPETYFKVSADSLCEDSKVKLSLVHETLSRATEAITDYCMRVKSSYYGRTDSQPFAFDRDGCGGLRLLTSGLKIRRAKEDNFFVSLKELVEGLQAIDNVGMGTEPDPDTDGKFLLRIEELPFFYTEQEVLFHDAIPEANSEVEESKHYSKILVGYKKWEVSRINGLDEYNSNREYRTGLTSVSNTLDITSSLVAGGYPIEVTRQQSFAVTGGADTTYDNETFIITGKRDAYGIEPEQGHIDNPQNIYSPATSYNFKLSPVRNLMHWYKSIVNSYASISDSENKLYFNSGTGNTVAAGIAPDGDCTLENQSISENQDLFTTHFMRKSDCTPLYKNEIISYEYPMSIADWKRVKANPYGYIKYQCGVGAIEKGYIKEIKYRPAVGMATFTLKKKWL